MSEINIEKKDSGGVPWWLWLLGALILAAIIWYAMAAMSAKTVTPVATADNSAMVSDNSTLLNTDNSLMNTDTNMAPAMGADANMAPAMGTDTNAAPAMGTDVDKSMSNSAEGNGTVPMASTAAITNILSVVDPKEPAEIYGKTVKLAGAPVQAAGTKVFWIGPSFEQKMLVVTDASTNMNGMNNPVAQRDRVNVEGTIQQITDFADAKTKYNLDDSAVTYLTNKKVLLMATSVSRDKN